MPKMTLLDIVQEILSDMNSDNVNSISDTIEAQQVANIVRRTYFNMHNERVWPHRGQLFRLNSSTDNTKPTHMLMDEDVISIEWVRYNTRRLTDDHDIYENILYKHPEDFLDYVLARNNTDSNVETVIDYNGTPLFIRNDMAPTFFTTFDDEHLVFDSYDNTVDSILQHSKTQVYGYVEPDFTMSDSFVPDLPTKVFPLLVAEAKSTAFLKIKEVFSQKDEQAAGRQRSWLSREKRRINAPGSRYPDYGKPTAGTTRHRYKNNQFTG